MVPQDDSEVSTRAVDAERMRAGAERAHGLDGALAAALERVARIAATSLRVPSAAVLHLGESAPTSLVAARGDDHGGAPARKGDGGRQADA